MHSLFVGLSFPRYWTVMTDKPVESHPREDITELVYEGVSKSFRTES